MTGEKGCQIRTGNNVENHQDALWLGAVNGGMQIRWKDENYSPPLVNIYYKYHKLRIPVSWGNSGRGGVRVTENGDAVLLNAYSGGRNLESGDRLRFDFELLLTPFKTIDRNIRFDDRYFHTNHAETGIQLEAAKETGANILNIHHATDCYPALNYPYCDATKSELTKLIDDAHANQIRLKLYYTTRELTTNAPEFWAFNSLNGEIVFPGPGNESRTEALHPDGPHPWLLKNL